jgi:hypothetical protein
MVTSKEVTILNPFSGKARKRPTSKRSAGKSRKTAGKKEPMNPFAIPSDARPKINPFKETKMATRKRKATKRKSARKARNPFAPHPAPAGASVHRVTLRTSGKGKRTKVWAPRGPRATAGIGEGVVLNPRMRSRKRRSSLRRSGNPFSLKTMFNKQLLLDCALIGVGFVGGNKVLGMVGDKLASLHPSAPKARGLLLVALGGIVQYKVKNPMAKKAGIGLIVSGVYDLVAQNLGDTIGIAPLADDLILSGTDINAEMLGVDIQDQSFVQGNDLDAELFGSDSLIMSDDDI